MTTKQHCVEASSSPPNEWAVYLRELAGAQEKQQIAANLRQAADEIDRLTTIKTNLMDALERKEERIKRMEREHIEELREVQRGGMSWDEATS